jgi:hypothetical protein
MLIEIYNSQYTLYKVTIKVSILQCNEYQKSITFFQNTGCRAQYLVSNYVEKIQKLI